MDSRQGQEVYPQALLHPEKDKPSLDPVILEKCRKLIAEGNAHLVSRKYYDAIINLPERTDYNWQLKK
jgi:hypothetical protein